MHCLFLWVALRAQAGSELKLVKEYGVLNDEMTSLHCNCTDSLMVASTLLRSPACLS